MSARDSRWTPAASAMLQIFNVLSIGLGLARLGLLLTIGFVLYRLFSLPSLPWLAAHYAIGAFTGPLSAFLLKHSMEGVRATHGSIGNLVGYWALGAQLLSGLISLLVLVLLVSEIAHLIFAYCPHVESRFLTRMLVVRQYVKLLGITLVSLSLTFPVAAFIFWLTKHA